LYLLEPNPHLFLSIILPQPTSTLFPYTTLFRSKKQKTSTNTHESTRINTNQINLLYSCSFVSIRGPFSVFLPCPSVAGFVFKSRSEEHTSELQSLAYLVCRLLLEKKKIICFYPL